MTQLRHDAAYIRTASRGDRAKSLSSFDEEVYETLSSAHTVVSVTKALARNSADVNQNDLEARVAASMHRLLEAERIELSPDS